jgi:hypothetical protein
MFCGAEAGSTRGPDLRGRIAQLAEHQDHNLGVTGSSPVPPTIPAAMGPIGARGGASTLAARRERSG